MTDSVSQVQGHYEYSLAKSAGRGVIRFKGGQTPVLYHRAARELAMHGYRMAPIPNYSVFGGFISYELEKV